MGGYKFYNANPKQLRVGDCVVRAISKLEDKPWDDVYKAICAEGFSRRDMPNANSVWGGYLRKNGYQQKLVPDTYLDCYTVARFAQDHPNGKYLLALDQHVVAIENGWYFDTWDSGNETVQYFWERKEDR